MNTQSEQLRQRTKQFAVRIVRLFRAMPMSPDAQVIGKQLLRCGTSVAANNRSACRARSKAEFISKIGIVLEEADEAVFWLELMGEAEVVSPNKLVDLLDEARQLAAIFTVSQRTAKELK